ncbi:MAG: chloride channel protein, partial [Nitrospinales bacterium]
MPLKSESDKKWVKRLLPKEYSLLILGALIGSLSGVASSVFRQIIDFFDGVFSAQGLSLLGIPSSIHFWFLPLMPMAGGLVIGVICRFFPAAVKENGVHEVMHAVTLKDGKISKSTILTTATTASITIGAGGSVGREGPTVQIGSAIGSALGRFFHQPTERLKILVGCGAAGGIAASFNAPLAGVLFALEIILCDFTISTFSPIVIASVAGTVVGQTLMGEQSTFQVPIHELVSYWEISFYLILGLLCGLVATFFFKAFFKIKWIFEEKVKINNLLKPALGGLIIGALSIFSPQFLGNGYAFMEQSLNGSVLWDQALLLIFLKIVATAI